MSVAEGFVRVATRLSRNWGVSVREQPGWRTRGRGTLYPRGLVRHWTAGSTRGGRYASLNVVTNGRPGLINALCNWYGPRGPGRELWIIAAGVAWHAGSGGWQGITGNSRVIGYEGENDNLGEEAHPDQIFSLYALDVELCREFGHSPQFGCEHYEWAPTRKTDRVRYNGGLWRAEVARLLAGEFKKEGDDDLRFGDTGEHIKSFQHLLNRLIYLSGGGLDGGGDPHNRNGRHLIITGTYDSATANFLAHALPRAQNELGYPFYWTLTNWTPAHVQTFLIAAVNKLKARGA